MPITEFHTWVKYRQKFGAMNDVRRYDRVGAVIAATIANVHGSKMKQSDFMPFGKEVVEGVASPEQLLQYFRGANGKSR
jgi:hypothetical protein